MIKILSLQESGQSVSDICREHGISQGTFYLWKNKYSGMGHLSLNKCPPKNVLFCHYS
ncbi:transposase [Sphingobacterium sp. N143]|nr:transposase [Sphingobacterium sp. N143]